MTSIVLEPQDIEAIRQAAADAEELTSGEIVPYLVGAADSYPEAPWRAATLGAIVAALASGLLHKLLGWWGGDPLMWATIPPILGVAVGWYLTRTFAAIRRWFVGDAELEQRVRIRAEAAFLDEEVFATSGRTGILVFVALFEHRAVILADSGIHQHVGEEKWCELVDRLVGGLKSGAVVGAMVEAIESCGRLLGEHGVERSADDVNELDNSPRVRAR